MRDGRAVVERYATVLVPSVSLALALWHMPAEPHIVPFITFVNVGEPDEHVSLVHALPSLGRSVFSATLRTPPMVLHSRTWQSPAVWLPAGRSVPAAVLLVWHVPALQLKTWQNVLVPQSDADRHCTHPPAPLQ